MRRALRPLPELSDWLRTALSAPVRRRATRTMLVVGTILVVINHVGPMLAGDFTHHRFLRILLTMAVPYIVSTVSSVGAMREMRRADPLSGAQLGGPQDDARAELVSARTDGEPR